MSIAALIRQMAAAGAPAEAIALAVEAVEGAESKVEARRAADRERKRIKREGDRNVQGMSAENPRNVRGMSGDNPPPPAPSPKPPTPPTPTREETPTRTRAGDDFPPDAFDRWYDGYPHKVGKGAARQKFEAARRSGNVTFAQLTDARDRYVQSKPPDRDWCNPATWLHQERWLDDPDPTPLLRLAHDQGTRDQRPNDRNDRIGRMLAGAMAAVDGT